MPTLNMTAQFVKAVKPQQARVDYFDKSALGDGQYFGLRVTPTGIKTWFVMYRYGGKLRRLTLGRFSDDPKDKSRLGLKDAKDKAKEELASLVNKIDPATTKQEYKQADTFGELADDFLDRYAVNLADGGQRYKDILNRDFRPAWKDRKAVDIRRRDVIAILDDIVVRGPTAANRSLACIRKLFNWAISRDLLDFNPAQQIPAPGGKERARDRVLTDDEVKTVWQALPDADMLPVVRLVLQLVLVTAQRNGEVRTVRKQDIDIDAGWWTIPGEMTKNGLSHRVPLTPMAIDIIKQGLKLSEKKDSDLVFPSPRTGGPLRADALPHSVRNNSFMGLTHWTPHDLRRTAASHMAADGTSRLVISKVLNHVETGITAVYDRHSYDKEKRAALEKWSKSLKKIIRPMRAVS